MNGKIITVGSTKGGVGKTTLALNIARALAGRDVWLIDADRQGTASTALAIRGEAGKLPAIATAHYAEGGQLRTQLLHQRGKFQDIVIDAGGRQHRAARRLGAVRLGAGAVPAALDRRVGSGRHRRADRGGARDARRAAGAGCAKHG